MSTAPAPSFIPAEPAHRSASPTPCASGPHAGAARHSAVAGPRRPVVSAFAAALVLGIVLALTVAGAPLHGSPAAAQEASAAGAGTGAVTDPHASDRQSHPGLERFVAGLDVPGAAAAVVSEHGIEEAAVTGSMAAPTASEGEDAGSPAGASAAVRWGSVSKGITGAVVDELVEGGRLGLDDTAGAVVPALPGPVRDVTVRGLLTHTSGLSHDLGATDRHRPEAHALDILDDVPAPGDHDGGFRYASTNYLVLQAIVEEVTDAPFAEAAAEHARGCAAEMEAGTVPFLGFSMPAPERCDGTGLGYGYLGGDLGELASWASWNLGPEGEAFHDRSRAAAAPTGAATGDSVTGDSVAPRYGYGWNYDAVEFDGNSEERIHHSGAVPGAFTRVEILPTEGLAVVLLVPEYGEPGSTAVAASAGSLAAEVLGDAAAGGGADAGSDADESGGSGSVLYPALVIAVLAAVLLAVGWCAVLLRAASPRLAVWGGAVSLALCAALTAALVLALPAATGLDLAALFRWAPDLASGAVAVAALLGIAALIGGIRVRRGGGRVPAGA